MNYCFYHKIDLDGKASGAIVKKYFKETRMDLELIPFNYNHEIEFEKYQYSDRLIFVDVVPQPYDALLKLHGIVKDGLYIIDHHISVKNSDAYKKLEQEIPDTLIFNDRYAGCELAWKYYYPNTMIPKAIARPAIWSQIAVPAGSAGPPSSPT